MRNTYILAGKNGSDAQYKYEMITRNSSLPLAFSLVFSLGRWIFYFSILKIVLNWSPAKPDKNVAWSDAFGYSVA